MTDEELNDICYECTGYGDDYYFDDNDEPVCACRECWVTRERKMHDSERKSDS